MLLEDPVSACPALQLTINSFTGKTIYNNTDFEKKTEKKEQSPEDCGILSCIRSDPHCTGRSTADHKDYQ
jgi:hypothetical protein